MSFWNIEQCKYILVDLNNGIMISKYGHVMGPLRLIEKLRQPESSKTEHTHFGKNEYTILVYLSSNLKESVS